NLGVAVLTASACLTHVAPLAIRRTRERLFVGDLRFTDARVDVEFALQAVDDDLEVQLAHAADDNLAGLLVGVDAERGILPHQLGETEAQLLLIALRLRLDRERDDRLGEVHRLEDDRFLFLAERVARADLLETDGRRDIAGVDLFDVFTL